MQNLLGRDLAAAAIAIDPAPIKGVPELPLSALEVRLSGPGQSLQLQARRVADRSTVPLRLHQRRSGAGSQGALRKVCHAGPGRPLFQAATATFNPNSATKVNVANASRGPLLLISGEKDNTVPPVLVKSTLKAYSKSPAVTEFKEFAGRGHSLTIDSGWRELAEYFLGWLKAKGL